MPQVDFSLFEYFPSLLCGESERLAYTELSDQDKDGIIPIFELSRRRQAPDFSDAEQMIRSAIPDRPFILDIDKRPAPDPYVARNPSDPAADARRIANEAAARDSYNAELDRLLDPDNGFSEWRDFASTFRNAIPTLQYTDAALEARQLLRQAALFSRDQPSLAIRIKPNDWESTCEVVSQIFSILPRPDQLLLIFDNGQGRSRMQEKINFVRQAIQNILAGIELSQQSSVRAVCMSNSFPSLGHDAFLSVASYDWRIWRAAREVFPFSFGDYAAVFRPNALSSFIPREWRPTVVYAKDEGWLANRDINSEDPQGWVTGSRAIVNHPDYTYHRDCWGNVLIDSASQGNITGANSPKFWHAAKINSHIHRQIDFSFYMSINVVTDDESDDDA